MLNVPEEPDEDEKYTVMGMLQKFLTPSLKTNEKSAEKFCLNSMKNVLPDQERETITVYGIADDLSLIHISAFRRSAAENGHWSCYCKKSGHSSLRRAYRCTGLQPVSYTHLSVKRPVDIALLYTSFTKIVKK